MGFLGSLFGSDTAAKGTNLVQTTDPNQLANAYNQTQSGLGQQQAFLQALQGQNGITNQSNVFNQQQQLANQLGVQAQGGGPNPVLAQLNQTTGQNVANQAALMAGQRGASSNVGLLARQAAQQGAGIQQQAVGQGALMRAQQQLAAQQALMGQQANQANLSTQQVGQQAQGLNAYNSAAQGQQANLLGAGGNLNNANVSMQDSINKANQQMGARQGGILGAVGNAVGKAVGLAGLAHGGQVGPKSQAAQFLAKGGNVGTILQSGGHVPGQAHIAGDSLKNDIVDAKLSPGEIVIPRSIAQGEDAPKKAAAFVQAILARQGR